MDILDAGRVRRFHTVPSHPHQTVAEHSWGAVMILLYIYPGATASCVRYMLAHDLGERTTGDIPAHAKWANERFKAALEEVEDAELKRLGFDDSAIPLAEKAAMKCADLLDLLLFCRRFPSDRDMAIICLRVEMYLNEHVATLLEPYPRARELIAWGQND